MTFTVNPWWVIAVLSLALFGVVFVWRVARDAARDLRAWWRDRGDPEPGKDDRGVPWCEECGGWHDWSHEDYPEAPRGTEWLPPERSAETLGFTGRPHRELLYGDGPGTIPSTTTNWPTFLERLEAKRERLASAAELEHRAAYEAMGLEFPSGLMARVREAAQ